MPVPHAALWRDAGAREEDAGRAGVLGRLLRGEPLWVIVPARGLEAPLPRPAAFRRQVLTIAPGDAVERDAVVEHLQDAGYERVETVTGVGQWALRGGIVDVFSPAGALPVRVELVGDEVESLRTFDPTSQRSTGAVAALLVLPMLPETADDGARLRDYLPADAPLAVADAALLEPGTPEAETLAALGDRPRVDCGLLVTGAPEAFRLETRSIEGVRGQLRRLEPALGAWRAEGFRVRLLAPDPPTAGRLQEILRDLEHDVPIVTDLLGPEPLAVLVAGAHVGFECPGLGLVCLTETELFGHRRTMRRRPTYQRGAAIAAFTDLGPGDLVVHGEHGIGRYSGLVTLSVDGQPADYLLLEYAEGARLYLPVQRMAAVTKYVGSGDGAPRLDKLGATTWQRTKESVRASLREMAQELLRLYAERQVVEGLAIDADTPWQHEFEAAFSFEETPDQLEAIRQVKADLERRQPMDRLVCGDVGYGKTEVAMRAALKVALDGHQVAVLVPTTILAEQHWNTFRERFAPYPVRVEMLSRFRSAAQQKAVLAGLAAGSVDVVIGTHRLLSKDVVFKDLGLLVVDEEHRFGVSHKERLKQLRKAVHVLTLTATPIPRTLSMAMSGIRDLSVIESPPADRLAIETVVCRFDPHVIKEAIERELGRGGQVFVVHNRIQSLPSLVRLIERLVPRARIAMAHGQLRGVGPRTNDARLRRRRVRCAGGHRHHRVGARHPGLQHDHHQPRGPPRAGAALPAARPGGPRPPPGVRLSPDPRRRPGRRGRGQAPPGDPGAHRPRLGAEGRAARHGDPGGRQPARRPAARPDRDGRVRPLPEAPRGGGAGAPRGGGRGRGGPGGHGGRGRLSAGGVRGRGGAAARALQAAGRACGPAAEVEDARAGAPGPVRALPEAAARLLDVVALRLHARALRLERLEVRGGPRAPHVRAEHAGVRLSAWSSCFGRTVGGSARVREFVLEATVPREPWPEHLPDPHPAPRGVPGTDGGAPMKRTRLALAGRVVAWRALGGCRWGAGRAAAPRAGGERRRPGARRRGARRSGTASR